MALGRRALQGCECNKVKPKSKAFFSPMTRVVPPPPQSMQEGLVDSQASGSRRPVQAAAAVAVLDRRNWPEEETRCRPPYIVLGKEERDALQMRLETSQALISRLQDREDRAGTHSILKVLWASI